MSESNLKKAVVSGTIWKFSERMLAQLVNFIVSIVLARLLMPSDYGIIVLVSVFITIGDKIVISGFATSLIQKKDADNVDFSTVLYFSMTVATILYALIFYMAPWIAAFYNDFDRDVLIKVLRILGLNFFILSLNSVQHAYVSKTMQFKRYFWSVLGGTLVSAFVGLRMAYADYGVWALVGQNLSLVITDTLILWFTVKWRPIGVFSLSRLKILFSFGYKIFLASIIKTIYNDLRSLLIGKFYSPSDLAFYNRGQTLPQLIDTNVVGTIDSVLFPALSKLQDTPERIKSMLRRSIRVSSFVLMPLLVGIAAVSDSFILILLTEKWLGCVPYVKILSFSFMFCAVEVENLQAIKALGRSDIVLKQEIIKRSAGILILLLSIPLGLKGIAYGMLVSQIIVAIVNAYPSKSLLSYSFLEQFKDVSPYLFSSLFMYAILGTFSLMHIGVWIEFIVKIISGICVYLVPMYLFKDDSMIYMIDLVRNYKKKH